MAKLKLFLKNKIKKIEFDRHFYNLSKINESLNVGVQKNYKKNNLVYIDVPEIVGITGACENIDTLFKVQNRLALPLFITQTGQLALEQSLQSFHGVYTVIHSGRDEEIEDNRHLRQFRLTEEEFDCVLAGMTRSSYNEEKMYNALLKHIENAVKAIIREVLKNNKLILEKEYQRNTDKLNQVLKNDFLRIEYTDCLKILNNFGFNLKFGDDLKAEHEKKIVEFLNKNKKEFPVFIIKYPKEIKFFNMKVSSTNNKVVLSADLIMPFSGEAVGSAVREHDFEKLNERLLTSTMYKLHIERGGKYEDFLWYLNIIKEGKTLPHAGYGIGNERILQYILGLEDIRHASLFSLLSQQTGDWDKKRYGQAGLLTNEKKYLLLSIGKMAHKKMLLPVIKKLAKKDNYIFYATKKTHLFLKKAGVRSLLVYKISELGKKPNILDLLEERLFDMIINIPRRREFKKTKEFTDGKLIRKGAINKGIYLVTDPEVAIILLNKLASN